MPDARYAFISAYLKGAEAKTITSDHLSRMVKVSSLQDVLGIIRETEIGSYLEGVVVNTFDDADGFLWQYFSECLRQLEGLKLLPNDMREILRAYTIKYDVSNIKAALQGISTGKKIKMIPAGVIYSKGLLDEFSAAKNADDIIDVLRNCKLEGYVAPLEEYPVEADTKSRLLAEARLDGLYYQELKNTAQRVRDGSTLSRAVGIMIDMANLQTILRAIIDGMGAEATQYVISGGYIISDKVASELLSLKLGDIAGRLESTPYLDAVQEILTNYDRTKSISVVEEITSKHRFRLVKEMLSLRLMSPLLVAWYLTLKEVETRNLRLILKATFDNIPLEEIQTFMVLSS